MKRLLFLLIALVCVEAQYAQSEAYRLMEDVAYRPSGDDYQQERCRLDVYYPDGGLDCPVVVWFHGGGLVGGNKTVPEQLKNSGVVVVAVNYRLMHRVTVRECVEDAAEAVAWVFAEIEKYGGNPDKIFLSGHSAGGYLITLIGLDKSWLRSCGIDADRIAALVPFSGQAVTHYEHRKTMTIPAHQPLIDEYAPIRYVRADAPPLIIISGDREKELYGRYEENAYFWRMMKVAGHKEVYLYELDGFSHGAMVDPAFHILKTHIRKILGKK